MVGYSLTVCGLLHCSIHKLVFILLAEWELITYVTACSLFSPLYLYFFPSFCYLFIASLSPILDHAVLPNAFPRIIYEEEKN